MVELTLTFLYVFWAVPPSCACRERHRSACCDLSVTLFDFVDDSQLALESACQVQSCPSDFVQSVPELTTQERTALESGDSWALRCAMKDILINAANKATKLLHSM